MSNIKQLQRIPIFKGLESSDLEKIAETAGNITVDKGHKVFTENDIGDSLYAIKSGVVRVLKKGREGNEEVARLNTGNHFGEMALIDKGARSATVEAVERTELIRIKREDLEDIMARDSALAHRVYKSLSLYLCSRLRQTTKDLTTMMDLVKKLRKFDSYAVF